MKAKRIQEGRLIDYVPETDVSAGDVVVIGDRCFFANLDIKAGTLGALATDGVYDVAKGETAIALGTVLYWDGEKATDSGAGSGEGGGNTRLGIAILDADADAPVVRVLAC